MRTEQNWKIEDLNELEHIVYRINKYTKNVEIMAIFKTQLHAKQYGYEKNMIKNTHFEYYVGHN